VVGWQIGIILSGIVPFCLRQKNKKNKLTLPRQHVKLKP